MFPQQPHHLCELPFQVSTHHIVDRFIQDATELKFIVLEKEFNQVLVVQENVTQISKALKKMVCMDDGQQQDDGTMCLVRMQLDTNQVKCIRIVQVKGIIGSYHINEKLIEKFTKTLDSLQHKKNMPEPLPFCNEASEFTGISSENLAEYYNMQIMKIQVRLEYQQSIELSSNPYYLETTAFYMFHKIFCASQYGMGKKIANQIKHVLAQISQPEIPLDSLRNVVQDLGSFITQIVDTLFQSFNFGKQETRQIMPFCRLSTEKYLYVRLYDQIYPLYQKHFKVDDQRFSEKAKLIRSQFTIDQIKSKFNISESSDDVQKFDSAVQEIKKLGAMYTPREKLRCFQIMNSILKAMNNTFLDEYRKICFLVSDIEDPYTQINFLMDGGANLDRKLLTQMKASFDQVQDDFILV